MKSSLLNSVTQQVLWFQLEDVEPMKSGYGGWTTFQPVTARMSLQDGEFENAVLSGPRILKSGEESTKSLVFLDFYPHQLSLAPDWLRELVEQAKEVAA